MILTRPEVKKLDFDLDGTLPGIVSFNFGLPTTDHRSLQFKYRGGWLTIWAADGPDDDADTIVFEERIGPPLHAAITIEQICDLTGMTVRGQRRVLSEAKWRKLSNEGWLVDFSGRRNYWIEDFAITRSATERLFRELRQIESPICLTDMHYSPSPREPGRCFSAQGFRQQFSFAVFSSEAAHETYQAHRSGGPVGPGDIWDYVVLKLLIRASVDTGSGVVNGWVERAASKHRPRYECFCNDGRLTVEYLNDNDAWCDTGTSSEEVLAQLSSIFHRHFSNSVEVFELGSGRVIRSKDGENWYSKDLAFECKLKNKRVLWVVPKSDTDFRDCFGVRPVTRSTSSGK